MIIITILSFSRLIAGQLLMIMIMIIIMKTHVAAIMIKRKKCFQADDYKLGNCGVRWGYVLACVGFFDAIILGIIVIIYQFFLIL